MALNLSIEEAKSSNILDALSNLAKLKQQRAVAQFAQPMEQEKLNRLKSLIEETNLGNQTSRLKMPYVAPKEQANLRDILAQAAQRETETRFIPKKYAISGLNAETALKNYLLNRERYSPESIDILNKYRQTLNEKAKQGLGNAETDAYGNPISAQPSQAPVQNNIKENIPNSTINNIDVNNNEASSGLPPLHDKQAIQEWIKSGNATPEKIQQFRSLLSESQQEPLRIPPSDEIYVRSKNARVIGGQPSEKVGSKGGLLKLMPTGVYSKMSEQYHAIEQVRPELDKLVELGKKMYAGIPLTPDEKDMYESQLDLVKDTFVGATHLPKLKNTFNTMHSILARKKFTTSQEYVNKLTHLQNKLNHEIKQLDYPIATGYEYFPGKK
jgi:hypothetical protein